MSRPPGPDVASELSDLFRGGRYAELEQAAARLLKSHPEHGFLWKALGVALAALGRHDEALDAKTRASRLSPTDGEAHANLANALAARGRYDEAVRCLARVAQLQPESPTVHNQLGNLLRDAGRMPEARVAYEQALTLQPRFAEALNNLGNTLADLGLAHEAEHRYRQALAMQPGRAQIHSNLGNLLKDQGRLAEAQDAYRAAVALDPRFVGAHSNLLLAMNHQPELDPAVAKAEAVRFGAFAAAHAGAGLAPKGAHVPADQPLKVGFVSPDLRNHPVGYFLEGVLAHLQPAGVRLFAYPTLPREDDLTARIKPRFERWQCIAGLDDAQAARLIHEDGVHVLVDLAGHTAYNRLGLFAWRPAPVQASWLGYFATTGVAAMDFLVADRASVAPSEEGHFTERLWYLPDTRLCFEPPRDAPAVAPLPAITNRAITFGSFQGLGKINDAVLAAWARVLQAVPGARLRLQNAQLGDPVLQQQLAMRLKAVGIAEARVSVHGRTSRRAYLQAYGAVDLVLDTYPYPGGTTTCEALWMGVPTITLAGDRMLSRQGASLLTAAGLPQFIASDLDEYVQLAVEHSSDPRALARLRCGLREQVRATPLFDAPRFAQNFAQALRRMCQAPR